MGRYVIVVGSVSIFSVTEQIDNTVSTLNH